MDCDYKWCMHIDDGDRPDPNKGLTIGVFDPKMKWIDPRIRVVFRDGPERESEKQQVMKIIEQWHHLPPQHSKLKPNFCFKREEEYGRHCIRVKFTTAGLSASLLGRNATLISENEPTMLLRLPLEERTVLHQFGHALGLHDEIHHPEAKLNYAEIFRDFGETKQTWDTYVAKYGRAMGMNLSPFDRESIMLFPLAGKYVADGKPVSVSVLSFL